jgi:hypothetical protein
MAGAVSEGGRVSLLTPVDVIFLSHYCLNRVKMGKTLDIIHSPKIFWAPGT